ncbi:O-antigen ligase family protein [Halomonas sp. MCCC 1A17488]|uniref:O-antigen ligase family protein n=1 Tax=unclassified Halomonas TaxID=2609666 RepID=UPI0018D23CEB|nr:MULTISPECIES: O-antigen ligase family protein [unclassified Halomonas]MCE8014834.1 O-antigen ligase family protein [Halomonas sp. MCCC 1A17488]MCG3238167.1 O-antigen ligase family protein [Halomonas sp. MCCC 1A17488]QPP48065.1 O-antigen ligase family protein [Halomonas sp. SS10-MC5]
MNIRLSYLAAFLYVGAVVNDAVILDDILLLSWSKVLFLLSVLAFLASGLTLRKPSRVEFFCFLYAFSLISLSLLLSSGSFSSQSLSVGISLGIGFISFVIVYRSHLDLKVLCNCFFCWMIISVALSFFQAVSGHGYISDRVFLSNLVPGLYRGAGLMSDPNYFGLLCLLALALTFSQTISHRLFVRGVLVIGVILSGSRASAIALLIILIFSAYNKSMNFRKISIGVLVVFFSLLVVYYLRDLLPHDLSKVFDPYYYSQSSDRNSLSDRFSAVQSAFSVFMENPFFGYGIGNFVNHPYNYHGQVSHNTYTEILAESGLAGILLFLGFFAYLLQLLFSSADKGFGQTRGNSLVIFILVFLAMSMTLVTHYSKIMFFVITVVSLYLGSLKIKAGV